MTNFQITDEFVFEKDIGRYFDNGVDGERWKTEFEIANDLYLRWDWEDLGIPMTETGITNEHVFMRFCM